MPFAAHLGGQQLAFSGALVTDDGAVDEARLAEITPETAARGSTRNLPDEALPMLAALWLVQGFDTAELRELAGLTKAESQQARCLLPGVLDSLGYLPIEVTNPYDQLPWRGYWQQIEWIQMVMDDPLSSYAAAQRVVELASDVPDLWEPAGGGDLVRLMSERDRQSERHEQIDDDIRRYIRLLRAENVPPVDEPL